MKLPPFLIDHRDGEIRVVGRRIGLYTLMCDYLEGRRVEEIAEAYELSPDTVRGVIAFYHENRDEVDAYVKAYQAELDCQYAEHVPGPWEAKRRRLMALVQQEDARRANDPEWTGLSFVEKALRMKQEHPAETT